MSITEWCFQQFYLQFQANECKPHSSHVGSVKFVHDDSYVISAGGSDAVLMQWAVVDKNSLRTNSHAIEEEDDEDLPEIFKRNGQK